MKHNDPLHVLNVIFSLLSEYVRVPTEVSIYDR